MQDIVDSWDVGRRGCIGCSDRAAGCCVVLASGGLIVCYLWEHVEYSRMKTVKLDRQGCEGVDGG